MWPYFSAFEILWGNYLLPQALSKNAYCVYYSNWRWQVISYLRYTYRKLPLKAVVPWKWVYKVNTMFLQNIQVRWTGWLAAFVICSWLHLHSYILSHRGSSTQAQLRAGVLHFLRYLMLRVISEFILNFTTKCTSYVASLSRVSSAWQNWCIGTTSTKGVETLPGDSYHSKQI